MENVYLALQLDKPRHRDHHLNRGWMNLFRRWAQAPFFRWAWAVSIGTYSLGFQTFCEEALTLDRMIRWRPGKEEELTPRECDYLDRQRDTGRFIPGEVVEIHQKTVQRYQIWVAEMLIWITRIDQSDSFPIGFAIIRLSRGEPKELHEKSYLADLMFYRIRNYYRQMRLLEKMIAELPKALEKELGVPPKLRVNFAKDEDRRYYSYFFERSGFEVVGASKTP